MNTSTTHPAPQLALIDQAFEAEIVKVSTVEYNSNAICRKFYEELRKRIEANFSTQSRPEAELPEFVVTDAMIERAWKAYSDRTAELDDAEQGSLMERMHAGMKRALEAAYGQQCAATRPAEVGGVEELLAADIEYDAAEEAWDDLAPHGIGELDMRRQDCDEWRRYNAANLRRAAAIKALTTTPESN